MLNNINKQEILNSSKFVREPVDNICNEINNNTSRKIILTGGRGIGKTTTLYNLENRGVGTKKQCIFTRFDSCAMSTVNQNETFNERFFNHYYELILSHKLLSYIKKYYGLTYENNFKEIKSLLDNISNDTNTFINNLIFEKQNMNRYLELTEYSSLIIDRLKKDLDISTISLAIDRFDWTNSNSILSQNILSNLFSMFDKVIITTDDESLKNEENKNKVENKGYSFVNVNYGKDKLVIKEIIRKRVEHYNKHSNMEKTFPIEIITDKIYQDLINKTNGNISLMLDSVSEVINMWNWKQGNLDLPKQFDIATNDQINTSIKIKNMSKQPKLYL
ncbi:MAG: hypothetical protein IJO32_03000 [Bacilli bacterium]|nr:hypothetical protein [Bacilli bacterium]